MEHSYENGCGFVDQLVSLVRTCGGFRGESPNYVGGEAIKGLRDAMASEGFVLTSDGDLRPAALDALSGTDLTDALASYVRRAQKGATMQRSSLAPERTCSRPWPRMSFLECWNTSNPPQNFPAALGQAFVALDLKTPADIPVSGEPPQHRLQRALYEAACAVNTLRNKQGTGHGRPWLPSVTVEEARHATQVMGVVGDLLLRAMTKKLGQ